MRVGICLLVTLCLASLCGCTRQGHADIGPESVSSVSTVAIVETAENAETAGTAETAETAEIAETAESTENDTVEPLETETEPEEETMVRYTNIRNPIVSNANDPWVVERGGHYYYCRSSGKGVIVSEVPSPYELNAEGGVRVYTAPAGTGYSAEYWAPELHYINGAWYIYVAADDGNNRNHRMYVLKGTTQDPTDPFEMVGQITDPSDRWAIDGTVMQVGGELYFVWSGWRGSVNVAQNLYIAHMSDPVTIDSERVMLSAPTYAWERVGNPYVNEGPTALYHGEDTFIVYSASGSWTDDYCLGLLRLVGDDPMNPDAWEKSAEPVFASRPGVAYGPGHCSFTVAVDGSIWMLYHANLESGTGWAGRSGWIAPVTFAEDGMPIFGLPRRNLRFPISVGSVSS